MTMKMSSLEPCFRYEPPAEVKVKVALFIPLGFKLEDLPPGYTEHSLVPSYPTSPPPTSPSMGPNHTEVFTPAHAVRE
ncbi:unnamed protein product [Boreogadus saida]